MFSAAIFSFLIGSTFSTSAHPSQALQNKETLTLYTRYGVYAFSRPDLATFNGVYNLSLPALLDLEVAAGAGESSGRLAQWTYKLQLTGPKFLRIFRFQTRIAKTSLVLGRRSYSSSWQNTLVLSFPVKAITFFASGGAAFSRETSRRAQAFFPLFLGSTRWTPSFQVGAEYAGTLNYLVKMGNFDVFDVYPIDEPFIHVELSKALNQSGLRVFVYGRLRFEHDLNPQLAREAPIYGYYAALGVVIPLTRDQHKAS